MKWEKKGRLFSAEDFQIAWMESHAQVPVAYILPNGDIRLYFNSRYQGKSAPTYVELDRDTCQIIRVNQEPLLANGRPGTFDDSGVMVSSIVEYQGKIYLYYVGWSQQVTVSYQNAIGLAVSTDGGETFTKYAEGPILGRNVNDPFFTSSPCVIRSGGQWLMYYLSCTGWIAGTEKMEPVYHIKYATSLDGIDWKTSSGNECIKGEGEAVSQPFVMRDQGKYRMWYSMRKLLNYRESPEQSYRIGYAESGDGIIWERLDKQVGIDVSEHGWDSQMVEYANVVDLGERKIMFYNGNGFGKTGIGYAVLRE
ncbi:MAG TPA: hypothetical protein DCR27_06565 [Lachnospiraceae bacterium]|nr:hypothetical protein [Lachnospiraceae bacterium]